MEKKKKAVQSDMIVNLSKQHDMSDIDHRALSQHKGQTFNTKLHAPVFCNHFPNLNTALSP